MDAAQTPYEPAWWGTELPGVRPRAGTYGRYDYIPMPAPTGVTFDGNFDWLRREPVLEESFFEADRNDVRESFPKLSQFCADHGIALPQPFVTFFSDLDLAKRIRSCTACFLDPATEPVASPKGDGSIVRFLSDQQGCLFWYLYLPTGITHHCVLCSTDYFATDAEEAFDKPPDPNSLVFAAPSFESFLFRFWLENECWYGGHGRGDSVSANAQNYLLEYGWPGESKQEESTALKPQRTARRNWWQRIFSP